MSRRGLELRPGFPDDRYRRHSWRLHWGTRGGTHGEQAWERRDQRRGEEGQATDKPVGGARGGITAPVTPSPELAEIVGQDDLPRSEVVKKVWDYIKAHQLQDGKDKRNINADAKLENMFGNKQASMFEMNKHLSAHLTAVKG